MRLAHSLAADRPTHSPGVDTRRHIADAVPSTVADIVASSPCPSPAPVAVAVPHGGWTPEPPRSSGLPVMQHSFASPDCYSSQTAPLLDGSPPPSCHPMPFGLPVAGASRSEPQEAAPRPGSVRAQIRALERRCTSQRQLSRGPCPGRGEGRRSGPATAGRAVPVGEAVPRISAPAAPWHSLRGLDMPLSAGPDEVRPYQEPHLGMSPLTREVNSRVDVGLSGRSG